MKRQINLSKDLHFPLDIVTSSGVIYGGKGMGKSNLGVGVLPEELHYCHQKFSIIDPMGVAWGLQHGADRERSSGIEVLIIGGKHGDIEIDPHAGAVVADLVVDEAVSTIIDISRHKNGKMWKKAEKIRFVADYCERLYERQGEMMAPLLQIIDECGRFCPQIIPHGSPELSRCVGAIEQLVEEGRNVGVGVVLITQRSARMNKSVSELADYMIAFRTVGPNSVKSIMDWLGEHVEKDRHRDIVSKLRELPVGNALVVSPGWLKHEGVVHFRARNTFDSSATPKHGQAKHAPGAASKPDLAKYRQRMAETIEKAQANDPGKLRQKLATAIAEVARLTKLKAAPAPKQAAVTRVEGEVKIVEVPVLAKNDIRALERMARDFRNADALLKLVPDLKVAAETGIILAGKLRHLIDFSAKVVPMAKDKAQVEVRRAQERPVNGYRVVTEEQRRHPVSGVIRDHDVKVGGNSGQNRMLEVIARRHPNRLTRTQVATMSGLSPTSGTFTTYLSRLVRGGLVEQVGTTLGLTDASVVAYPQWLGQAQSREDVLALWQKSLGATEWRMLTLLIDQGDNWNGRVELAQVLNMSPTSGTFTTYLSRLRRNALIEEEGKGGRLRASRTLLPEGEAVRV